MTETLIIRFPDRRLAFRQSSFAPAVGDRFTLHGAAWVVVRVASDAGRSLEIAVKPADAGLDVELDGASTEERALD